jgi:hypothetical protein
VATARASLLEQTVTEPGPLLAILMRRSYGRTGGAILNAPKKDHARMEAGTSIAVMLWHGRTEKETWPEKKIPTLVH